MICCFSKFSNSSTSGTPPVQQLKTQQINDKAHANLKLIDALRITAQKLAEGGNYQWEHMGSCNCGNLAQELTQLTKAEIHQFAMQGRRDWREQVGEFCPTSGLNIDLLIADLWNH